MRRVILLAAITLLVSPRGMHSVETVPCKQVIGAVPQHIAHRHPCTESKTYRR